MNNKRSINNLWKTEYKKHLLTTKDFHLLPMEKRQHESFEFWNKLMGDQKHNVHCGAVIDACLGMIKDTTLNEEVFIIAGWIHDMGKIVDKENHHLESVHFLNRFLKEYPVHEAWREQLEDCIVHHRSSGKPKTIYGQIFKCADKVALQNNDWLAFKKEEK